MTKNANARKAAHKAPGSKNAGLDFLEIATNCNYYTARGLEQIYMGYYHTLNGLNSGGLNGINGISPNNPNRGFYMNEAYNYINNQITNEILMLLE